MAKESILRIKDFPSTSNNIHAVYVNWDDGET